LKKSERKKKKKMPESAEVKLTAEYLDKELGGKVITSFVFLGGQYKNKLPEGFEAFEEALPLIVEGVNCKGKLIYFRFLSEHKTFILTHSMRLTGAWKNEADPCSRWYIEVDPRKRIWFRDPRCLATLRFTDKEEDLKFELDSLGPDILTENFTLPVWRGLVASHKNKNITSFLMDQSILSGCGNYIKAEALYHAGVSPFRKVGSLSEKESEKIFEALRLVPRLAYNYKVSEEGGYSDGRYEFLKIYGSEDATLSKTADGRVTHWDPEVQG